MKRILAGLSGALAGVLPALACPACAPAYAGLLSALGIGVIGTGTGYVLFLAALLSVSITTFGIDAWRHRKIGPLSMGVIGCTGIILSKFVIESSLVGISATVVLIAAAIWNGLLVRRRRTSARRTAEDTYCSNRDCP